MLTLKYVDKVKFEIDSTTSPFYIRHQFLETDNKLIISNMNEKDKSLLELDLSKKIVKHLTNPLLKGNNLTLGNGHFYYHNKDSIFFIGPYNPNLYLTNIKGEISKVFKLQDINKRIELGQALLIMGSINAFYNYPNFIYVTFPIHSKIDNMELSKKDPLFIKVNLLNHTITPLPLTYELNITQQLQYPGYINPIVTMNTEGDLVFTFPTSDKIFIYDIEKKHLREVNITSNYFDRYIKLKKYEDIATFDIESYENEKIVFNPKSQLYYLFTSHKTSLINPDNGLRNDFYSKPFSIRIFDKNFKKILDKEFKGDTYNLSSSFVSNDYLYLSINNPKNKDFNEDYFQFKLFKIVEKK